MKKADRLNRAEKFEKSAASLRSQVDSKRNPAIANQNITARRARIAAGMSADADYLERILKVYEGLANDLRDNTLPRVLARVTTRAMIERLLAARYRRPGLHFSTVRDALRLTRRNPAVSGARGHIKRLKPDDYWLNLPTLRNVNNMITVVKAAVETGKENYLGRCLTDLNTDRSMILAGITNAEKWQVAHDAALSYCSNIPDRQKERELRDLEYSLIGAKIPGFFPTPATVVKEMLELAGISQEMAVLEPSAGKGDIAELIRSNYPEAKLRCVEHHYTLAKVLDAKGFNCEREDFLHFKGEKFDRVVMNPPFENFQDIDHVRHAYDLLAPGGRLVSIMCESVFFRKDRKAANFRDWLDSHGGDTYELGSGAFTGREAFRQTGVNSRIVVIDKD